MTRHIVATVDEIAPGTSKVVTVNGREVGVFNIGGEFFALLNRCPHMAADLCKGAIVPLVQSSDVGDYQLHRHGEFIRCPWHGWEFEIRSGQSYCDPRRTRVRKFDVKVEPGEELVKGPYKAETFAVSVERNYVVIEA
jgi:nitrite reductase/ring-hydroxylating ferredoxin subunit